MLWGLLIGRKVANVSSWRRPESKWQRLRVLGHRWSCTWSYIILYACMYIRMYPHVCNLCLYDIPPQCRNIYACPKDSCESNCSKTYDSGPRFYQKEKKKTTFLIINFEIQWSEDDLEILNGKLVISETYSSKYDLLAPLRKLTRRLLSLIYEYRKSLWKWKKRLENKYATYRAHQSS